MELDLHYTDPRLVELYDLENVWGPDNDFWLQLADDLRAGVIIDLGCGTGLLTRALAVGERSVIGIDPSPAMLAVARRGRGADKVRWIQGDAAALGAMGADLALMTGNVAQVFLDDEVWESALRSLPSALKPGGRLAFDSRNPGVREWERWTKESTYQRLETPDGPVETWIEVVAVEGDLVRVEGHNLFVLSGELIVAPSTLRFRSAAEIAQSLERTGFVLIPSDSRPAGSALGNNRSISETSPHWHHRSKFASLVRTLYVLANIKGGRCV